MNEQVLTIEAIPASVYRKLIKIEDPRPWAENFHTAMPYQERNVNAIGKGDSVTVEVSLHQLSGRFRMKVSPHS